jgi:uncharacterized integral membrane protein
MPTEGDMRRVQWGGLIGGIGLLPVLLGVLYMINTSLAEWSVLFVVTDLLLAAFLVGDVVVVVRAAKRLGLMGGLQ